MHLPEERTRVIVMVMVTLRLRLTTVRGGVMPRQHGCSSWDETWTSWTAFTDRRSMTCRKPGLDPATYSRAFLKTCTCSGKLCICLFFFIRIPKKLKCLFVTGCCIAKKKTIFHHLSVIPLSPLALFTHGESFLYQLIQQFAGNHFSCRENISHNVLSPRFSSLFLFVCTASH